MGRGGPRCAASPPPAPSQGVVPPRRPRRRKGPHRMLARPRGTYRPAGTSVADRGDGGLPGASGSRVSRPSGAHQANSVALRRGGSRLRVFRLRDARLLQRDLSRNGPRPRGPRSSGRTDGRVPGRDAPRWPGAFCARHGDRPRPRRARPRRTAALCVSARRGSGAPPAPHHGDGARRGRVCGIVGRPALAVRRRRQLARVQTAQEIDRSRRLT
jgi:hypothetical protein